MKKLVVQLRPDGSVAAETFGMTGAECLDYIEQLEALLEAETTSSQFTEDYTRTGATASDSLLQEDRDR
ncbi:DUF2997 domain-containing protein [Microbacterium sp. LKL04]|uniref:DUF2997 domain-containing protein n=1 Tax=unclassified Microbacterium TaxID=2609290 RepID=UPI000875CC3C|nr:DUF2997 domain-containing protein [Microbacterium sp. LKL04]SCY60876.1 Protein of unknown function [Microbacterium sp. LKL04]